jgi:very-short-patch-repair endonuclease
MDYQDSDLERALSEQSARLLLTNARSPMIQFRRKTGTQGWLTGFSSLTALVEALPEGGKRGLPLEAGEARHALSLIGDTRENDPASSTPLAKNRSLALQPDATEALKRLILTLPPAEAEKHLNKLYRAKRTYAEETGLDVLRVCLGFLEWRDPKRADQTFFLSPLLALSVDLIRQQRRFELIKNDSIEDNAALRHRLKIDFRLDLPEFDEDETPDEYLDRVEVWLDEINQSPQSGAPLGMARIVRHAALATLNFMSIRLYRDLQHPALRRHAGLRHLLTAPPSLHSPSEPVLFDQQMLANEAESRLPPLVFDADGSQHAVLIDALALSHGQSPGLVVEGPPGTGKSQTIANLIAAALNDGMRVLFVSQKQAALEVVRRKLEAVGLGAFCLDLHGLGTTRQGFLNRIQRRLTLADLPPARGKPEEARDAAWRALALPAQALAAGTRDDHEVSGFEAIWRAEKARSLLGKTADKLGLLRLSPTADGGKPDTILLKKAVDDLARHWSRLSAELPGFPGRHALSDIARRQPENIAVLWGKIRDFKNAAENLLLTGQAAAAHFRGPLAAERVTLAIIGRLQSELDQLPELPAIHDPRLTHLLFRDENTQIKTDLDVILTLSADHGTEWLNQDADKVAALLERATAQSQPLPMLSVELEALQAIAESVRSDWGATCKMPKRLRDFALVLAAPAIPEGDDCAWLTGLPHAELAKAETLTVEYANLQSSRQRFQAFLAEAQQDITGSTAAATAQKIRSMPVINFGSDKRIGDLPPNFRQALLKLVAGPEVTLGQFLASLDGLADFAMRSEALTQSPLLKDASDIDTRLNWCRQAAKVHPGLWGKIAPNPAQMLPKIAETRQALLAALTNWDAAGGRTADALPFSELQERLEAQAATARTLEQDVRRLGLAVDPASNGFAPLLNRLQDGLVARDRLRSGGWCDQSPDDDYADWSGWVHQCKASVSFAGGLRALPQRLQTVFTDRLAAEDFTDSYAVLLEESNRLAKGSADFARARDTLNLSLTAGTGNLIPADGSLLDFSRLSETLLGSGTFDVWLEHSETRRQIRAFGYEALLSALADGLVRPDQTQALADYLTWRPIAESVLSHPGLVSFTGAAQEGWQRQFAVQDAEARLRTAREIARRLALARPETGKSGHKLSEMTDLTLLRALMSAKTARLSIRKLMHQSKHALRTLFPCFMMGPLAIAQYLEPDDDGFDLVVMDEASQLPLHEGLGAIARGKRFVVIGDAHQMPPSGLFRTLDIPDDENEDDQKLPDAESILQQAKARVASRELLWHYRSHHESLINFANTRVYGNRLRVFPCRIGHSDLGVRLIPVENPRYANQQNLPEALTVVEVAIRLMKAEMLKDADGGRRTLGIVAINAKQTDLIEDCLNSRRATEPVISAYAEWAETRESFFVKNLENVQGDERDIMLISLTYGPGVNGQFYQRLGPIGQKGGYRRLNVLITRARQQMLVVSSLRPDQVSPLPHIGDAEGELPGRTMLRRFLDYVAEGGRSDGLRAERREAESPFEEAVGAVLDEAGIDFDWQVGSAGARIDIAIRHPNRRGDYVLAVECDGEQYHRAASRRDADRIRQERLEAQGWRFHRIWSSDWYSDPEAARASLIAACRAALLMAADEPADSADPEWLQNLTIQNLDVPLPSGGDDETHPEDAGALAVADVLPAIEGTKVTLEQWDQDRLVKLKTYLLKRGNADASRDELSLHSPLGQQLEDRLVGEEFTVNLPTGAARYRVRDIVAA